MFLWSKKKKKRVNYKDLDLGKSLEDDLKSLLVICRENLKSIDETRITKAFHWCTDAHEGKLLKSGKQYYLHPLSVAIIVAYEMPLDDTAVIASLLHTMVKRRRKYTLKDIKSEFGNTVAEIVSSMSTIQSIEDRNLAQLENYRKLMLSLFTDVRIILIKLADRLDNMRTSHFLPPEKQKILAEETFQIYVPFANRFGLGSIKWELEDLAFRILNRKKYDEIRANLQLSRQEREQYVDDFIQPIKDRMEQDKLFRKRNINIEITGRAKHIYSIHNKILARQLPMSELYDLFAVRLIIDTQNESDCYIVYGLISDIYNPVPGTFKNYIANPKPNGYKSIHSAFYGKDNRPVEVQIRTKEMHEIAERGVASHFNYKRGALPAQSILDDTNLNEWLDLVRNFFENIGEASTDELIRLVKEKSFRDEIYVFTPAKEFRIFPKDTTPIDFAFSVHTDIGLSCIGAKVNGRIVPLDYKLQSGDQIEILSSKNQTPNKEWLKFVVTQKAKSNIQKYLKEQKKKTIEKGEMIWEDTLKKMGLKIKYIDMNKLIVSLNYKDIEDFFQAISTAGLDQKLLEEYILEFVVKNENGNGDKTVKSNGHTNGHAQNQLIKVELAPCCGPLPGDEIIAVMNKNKKMEVHQKDCPDIDKSKHNWLDIDWDAITVEAYNIMLKITGEDNPHLIAEITSALSDFDDLEINKINFDYNENEIEGSIQIRILKYELINDINAKLHAINGVRDIQRTS